MTEYVISCCSTADLPASFFKERNVPYLCFHVHMDGEDRLDDMGATIPMEEFFAKIAAGATPTTSQINVEEYIGFFEPFLQQGMDVLHLTLSSGISGTYMSACIARDDLLSRYPDRKLVIVDSLAASAGYGLLVDAACDKRDAGMVFDDLCRWVEENKRKVNHWFFSTDLSSYKRGGRISPAAAAIGTLLGICPLLNVDYLGRLIPRKKVRGKKQVIQEIVRTMQERAENGTEYAGKCFLSESACMEDANSVASLVMESFPHLDGKVRISSIGMVIGAHTGPGTVALFFWGKEREKE